MAEKLPTKGIKTTGDLREFLVMMMLGVKNGDIDYQDANTINKLASQVNESFYAEIKTAKVRAEAGEQMPKMGDMPINRDDVTIKPDPK